MSGEVVNNVSNAINNEAKLSSPDNNTAHISGNVNCLIDPNTMLVNEENNTRVIDMQFNAPGIGFVPVKLTETRQYEFKY